MHADTRPNGPTYRQPDECPHGNRRHCIAYSVADRQPHGNGVAHGQPDAQIMPRRDACATS